MRIFEEFVTQYWPDIVTFLAMLVGYFLVFLYKHSTRNLNTLLKDTFKENTESIANENKLFEDRTNYALKQARAEYLEAMKLCEEYQKRVEHLEKTLEDLLNGGDTSDERSKVFNE